MRSLVLPVLAAAGLAAAVFTSLDHGPRPARPAPKPSLAPQTVIGAGLVEASTRDIEIAAYVPGVVAKVAVSVGDEVSAGDPLFTVDDRQLRAQLDIDRAVEQVARTQLTRLQAQPRTEQVAVEQAAVTEAQVLLEQAQTELTAWQDIRTREAVSEDELRTRRFALENAKARLGAAQSRLDLLNAGAWDEDVLVAAAQLAADTARVKASEVALQRATVTAPVTGRVLQVNIRAGEYAPAGPAPSPLMLVGATETLHVRVDVDENDAWRIRPDAKAWARIRGNPNLKTDLQFVGIEPFVLPKKSLTGDSTERVDTRVLQVVYAFPGDALPVYVGQQMDVFIEAPPDLSTHQ